MTLTEALKMKLSHGTMLEQRGLWPLWVGRDVCAWLLNNTWPLLLLISQVLTNERTYSYFLKLTWLAFT